MTSSTTRLLGKNGPMVQRIGYGTMGLAIAYGKPLTDEQRFAILDHAHKIGNTFWDTSDFYGDVEDTIGNWFSATGKRGDIFLATKFGACKNSLQRLNTDYIDLWYPHRLDGSTPGEHNVAEMAKLKEQGKIRNIGLCEVSAATLRLAYAVHPIAAVQIKYSPFSTEIEGTSGLLAACRELGVAVVAYSPLSRGLLSRKLTTRADFDKETDVRAFYSRFSEENFPKNLAIVDELRGVADMKNCTPGQLCLAWLLSQGDDIFPIPGTRTLAHLDENFSAMEVELSADEVARIRSLVDNVASGERYAPEHMLALFADTPLPDDKPVAQG
ncbi:Aldo/keto reductase [Xylariaceae sp. FL0255]|nr:Aldo/keto reductase [Xylariaceae sp. FL0255]